MEGRKREGETKLASSNLHVITGVLDFYIFVGSSPDDIIQMYQEVIGRPAMPPYWALGFHQCRYGYENIDDVKDVVEKFASYQVRIYANNVE